MQTEEKRKLQMPMYPLSEPTAVPATFCSVRISLLGTFCFADVGWDFSEGHEWAGDLWRFVPNNDNKNSNLKNLFLIGLINFVYWLQPSFRTWCSWSRRTLTSPPSLDRSAPTSCPLLKWKRDLSPGVVLRKWMTTMSGNTEAALTDS